MYFFVQLSAPKKINWTETYTYNDKIPYGTAALHDLLEKMSPNGTLPIVHTPIYNQLSDKGIVTSYEYADSSNVTLPDSLLHNYLFINTELNLPDQDARWLLHDVYSGNDVMICAKNISSNLSDSLHLTFRPLFTAKQDINLRLPEASYHCHVPEIASVQVYIDSINSTTTKIIGNLSGSHPNFICVNYGSGHFYINTSPELFTNYYIVNDTTYTYAFNCLSRLNYNRPIWWDEYYKEGRIESRGSLDYIFSQPALKLGWYIFLVTMLMFLIFESKRRQKAIAVISQVRNDSLEFVKQLGAFYFQTTAHRIMAEKKWKFLAEHIRLRYNINSDLNDATFEEKLSRKSGYPLNEVKELLTIIRRELSKKNINEQELMQINYSINRFYHFTTLI